MSDYADDARKAGDTHFKAALSNRRPEGPQPNGRCHNCEAPLEDPKARWCDALCRDDWEFMMRMA